MIVPSLIRSSLDKSQKRIHDNTESSKLDPMPITLSTDTLIQATRALSDCNHSDSLDPVIQLLIEHTIKSACSSISHQFQQEKSLAKLTTLGAEHTSKIIDLEHRVSLLKESLSAFNCSPSCSAKNTEITHAIQSLENWILESKEQHVEDNLLPRCPQGEPTTSTPKEDDQALQLNVQLFGTFAAKENGRLITQWPKGKAKQIFKYLAYTNKPAQKEVLMEMFWPNHTLESARNNLNVTIYSLRKTLKVDGNSDPLIIYRDGSYQFNSILKVSVDTASFEDLYRKLMHALANNLSPKEDINSLKKLYRGDFFNDDLYCSWASEIREGFRDKYLNALRSTAEYYYQKNELNDCIEECLLLASMDSCDESANQTLMECYGKKGQRHLAVKQYEVLKKSLRDELNLSPSHETESVINKIRNTSASSIESETTKYKIKSFV